MPGTPKPVIDPRFGPAWTPIIQNAQAQKQQAAALNSGSQNTNLTDGFGNTTVIIGQITGQIITIGATAGVAGVTIQTPVFNFAVQDPRLHHMMGIMGIQVGIFGTINTTSGSGTATCTVTGALGGTSPDFTTYNTIGAADVSDPSTGTATPALPYGTTVNGFSGTYPNYTLTLTENAQETGSGLYFATCAFTTIV